jgi:hypothetical protein
MANPALVAAPVKTAAACVIPVPVSTARTRQSAKLAGAATPSTVSVILSKTVKMVQRAQAAVRALTENASLPLVFKT